MPITASQLRADVYRLLDRAIETGEPLEIERNGVVLRLVPPPTRPHWFDRLPRRDIIVGDPEEIVHIDWSAYWNPEPL